MKIPLQVRTQGLYCTSGDFYIDAWDPVPLCLVTHAHSDHARSGHGRYIVPEKSLELLKYRLGSDQNFESFKYGEKFKLGKCWVSFHPAGHILGSAQIKIENKESICVISGDYKRAFDLTCDPFELQQCDTFVTESTFALPIYNWESSEVTAKHIYEWWQENREQRLCSVIYCYALGKAQRIMSMLASFTDRPIYLHGAIFFLAKIYAEKGISLIPFRPVSENTKESFAGELILAPPSAKGSRWLKRFYPYKTAFASGWMQVRGLRKQKNVDKAFVLSDHADWPDLLKTISETQASTILTTHGNAKILAQYLQEQNFHSFPLEGMEILDEGEDKQ